jgi:hypothetical protein
VLSSGVDKDKCGTLETPCLTLNYAIKKETVEEVYFIYEENAGKHDYGGSVRLPSKLKVIEGKSDSENDYPIIDCRLPSSSSPTSYLELYLVPVHLVIRHLEFFVSERASGAAYLIGYVLMNNNEGNCLRIRFVTIFLFLFFYFFYFCVFFFFFFF